MKFILSRTDDYTIHSKKWIIGYGLLFWLVSRIVAMCLVVGCIAIYNSVGIDPETATRFSGDPETAATLGSWLYILLTVSLVAPVLEECIFRLGLSFRRVHVALAAASVPAYFLWQSLGFLTVVSAIIYVGIIAAVFSLIYFLTTDSFWQKQKARHLRSAIWITAIGFGLIHLIAFSDYSLALLPYMLCVVTVPLFAGFAITYYRINLGFGWGVGMHIFNNIPAMVVMLL
ncbi:MAG: hypothetical protein Q4C34_07825 [Bacteroidales bacterium]|nr:hypothetical protein [Bacteroidales bacterium]